MRINEVLKAKGDSVYQIPPSATLADAVERMVKFNCGSLIVSDDASVVGIITERDILKVIASEGQELSSLLVCEFMSRNLITGHPDEDIENVMGLMTNHRIRHLPIMVDDRLAGMISIGDVVKAQYDLLAFENHYLKVYIQS